MSLDDAHRTINFRATNRIADAVRHEPQRECPRCARCRWSVLDAGRAQCQFCTHVSDDPHHYLLAKNADKRRRENVK
jgi:hypothetical protein